MKSLVRALLPRGIRPRRIKAGPLRGAWIVASWHDYPAALTGRTERALLDWFARHVRQGETWLDIGAHYGYTAFALSRLVGPGGRVFAFEPVLATAGCIDQGRTLNQFAQLTILPFALAAPDTIASRTLPLTRGMADATFSAGADHVSINMARFDWLWPLIHGGNAAIHGVKIDVQGMELETLDGMREALGRWRPRLVVELHTGVDPKRLVTLLAAMGYARDAEPINAPAGAGPPALRPDCSYAFHPA